MRSLFSARNLVLAVIVLPVLAGVAGTIAPAFGYLPALGGTAFTLVPISELLDQPHLLRSSMLSLATGLAATAASLLLVAAFIAGFSGTRLFSRIEHLISPLLAVPHAAAAFGLAFLIAPSGLLLRLVSPELTGLERPPDWLVPQDPLGLSLTAGLIAKEMPFLFLVALAALNQVPAEQARRLTASLGYGRIKGFFVSLWPPIYGQIRLPVFAVLAYATSTVDVAMILGPDLPAPLSVRVADWMGEGELHLRFLASAGALLQMGVTLLAFLIWLAAEQAASFLHQRLSVSGERRTGDGPVRLVASIATALSSALVFLGLLVLALWSIAGLWPFPASLPNMLTAQTWMKALPQAIVPDEDDAGACRTFRVIWRWFSRSGCSGRRAPATGNRRIRGLLYLPLIVPQLGFVFGLQILQLVSGWDASFPLLVLVHLVFVLPYVFLSLSQPWHAFDRRYEHLAAGLGASAWRILLRVRLPMLTRACLTALAVGFAVSVGLYLPTLLIGAGRITTITTEAVALSSGGDRRIIGVYALLQTLPAFAGFAIASLVPRLLFRHRRAMRI